jgi:hypothetical protein
MRKLGGDPHGLSIQWPLRGSGDGAGIQPRAIGPAVAGTWYPADPERLRADVDALIQSGSPRERFGGAPILGVIVPHAGFMYSGEVAGQAFSRLRGARYERVLLLGPSHYAYFRGAVVPDADVLRTPLGEVAVDRPAIESLRGRPGVRVDNAPFAREHCLEAEIPFLQRSLAPGWSAVPVLVGSGTAGSAAEEVADALRPLLGPAALVVVSSDFTHFGASFGYLPFRDRVPERIREVDHGAVEHIVANDVRGFEEYLSRTDATICGRDAIGILMRLLRGPVRSELVAYDTSGRMTGDYHHTVSYASLVVRREARLDQSERATLLALARAAVQDAVRLDGSLEMAKASAVITPAMREPGAAFVTLKEERAGRLELRGCVGAIAAVEPLLESVIHGAVNAALHDARFTPVTADELPRLALSISVLTPPRKVSGAEAIVIGRHGVLLEKGRNKAVFLPQVATEQGWGTAELLTHLALKAGLPRDGWKGAELSVFEAEVFGTGE